MESPSPDPHSGATLHGRYTLGRCIRSGSSGSVYAAQDLVDDRAVTVTVMHPWLTGDHAAEHAFLERAQTLSELSHPGLTPVLGHGRDGDRIYAVTENAPGKAATEILRETDQELRHTPHKALAVVADVLSALDTAHQADVVHGDIGTDKVFLDEDTVRLSGFPFLFDDREDEGPDTRTDVYQAGALLYTLMTGVEAIDDGLPLRPSTVVFELPPDIDMLVANATDPNPRYRPRDAGQYLTLVEQVLRSLPREREENDTRPVPVVTTAPDTEADRNRKVPPLWRRVPVLVTAGVLVIALLAAGWAFVGSGATELPDVLGSDPETAEAELAALDLELVISHGETYSDTVDLGSVADTSPRPGAILEAEDEVVLWLSDGPQHVEIPEVAGDNENDARNTLREAGFTDFEVVQEHSAEDEPGTVLSTDPEAGEQGDREEKVTLHVSEGIIVPELLGMDRASAEQALDGLELGVEVVEAHHDTVPEDEVLGQTPEPGAILPEDGSVTLTVSLGPEEEEDEEEPDDGDTDEQDEEQGDRDDDWGGRGDRDDDRDRGCGDVSAWDAHTIYDTGDLVHYRGRVYEAQWWIEAIPPHAAEEWGAWTQVGRC